jgi:hypothetical protein
MAMVLTGIMQGMRPVGNKEDGEHAAGEKWQFLSMEITDPRFGQTYSCQLSDRDPQYKKLFDGGKLLADYTGHKVKVTIRSIQATERAIEDEKTGEVKHVLQTRIRVTNLRDLGESDEDE